MNPESSIADKREEPLGTENGWCCLFADRADAGRQVAACQGATLLRKSCDCTPSRSLGSSQTRYSSVLIHNRNPGRHCSHVTIWFAQEAGHTCSKSRSSHFQGALSGAWSTPQWLARVPRDGWRWSCHVAAFDAIPHTPTFLITLSFTEDTDSQRASLHFQSHRCRQQSFPFETGVADLAERSMPPALKCQAGRTRFSHSTSVLVELQ